MTTTATRITTAAEPILALHLGKYKSVACVYRGADGDNNRHRTVHRTLDEEEATCNWG